ncbi:hypothetical protein G9A89_016784, partial [Geosiphon pyriformis]
MAHSWYYSLAQKPQNFNVFKLEFLRYFSDNNSINRLASTFTTIKQEDTKAVTTYLGYFHRNLSILQRVCLMHPVDLPTAMTHAKDFETTKLKANHVQAVNLVMNGSSDLDSKLKQFSDNINQKLESYLADNCAIYQSPQQHNDLENANHFQNQSRPESSTNQSRQPETFSDSKSPIQSRAISKCLPAYDTATNLSANNILTAHLSAAVTNNLSTTATSYLSATASNDLSISTSSNAAPKLSYNDVRKPEIQNHPKLKISQQSGSRQRNSGIGSIQNPNSQNYLSLLVIPEDVTSNNPELNQQPTILTNNISPAIVTNNKSLAAIFLFELEKVTSVPLFSEAALKKKPITAMYIDVKVNGHSIKLILDSGLAS